MWAYRNEYEVTIIRPHEASRLNRYEGKLLPQEIAPGLEIDHWIHRVRTLTERVALGMGCHANVDEMPVLPRRSRVPNHDRRKRLNSSDLVIVPDPDDLFLEYLEEEPLPANPMFSVIIATLRRDIGEMRRLVEQLPKTPLLEFDDDGTMKEASRVEVLELRDERTLPGVIKRSLCA